MEPPGLIGVVLHRVALNDDALDGGHAHGLRHEQENIHVLDLDKPFRPGKLRQRVVLGDLRAHAFHAVVVQGDARDLTGESAAIMKHHREVRCEPDCRPSPGTRGNRSK